MGRGLSPLQKFILEKAYNTSKEKKNPDDMDIYYRDVLIGYFGFKKGSSIWGDSICGSHYFSKSEIGDLKYQAAQASISRAFRRLEKRGLIHIYSGARSHWTGGMITNLGKELFPEQEARS